MDELKEKISELEIENTNLMNLNKNLQKNLNDFEQYKSTITFYKEEISKTKKDKHLIELELDKFKS